MGEPDFDDFIRLQKERLAKERQTLADSNNNRQDASTEGRRKWQQQGEDLRHNYAAPYIADQASFDDQPTHGRLGPQQQWNGSHSDSPASAAHGNTGSQDARALSGRGAAPGPPTGDSSLFSGLGEYEKKRQALNEERKREYNERLSERKHENPRAGAAGLDGRAPPGGNGGAEAYEATLPGLRDRLSAEQAKVRQRNAEYNELLRTKQKPSTAATMPSDGGETDAAYLATLPGIRERLSAEQEKVRQRNAEYNEFLQQRQQQQHPVQVRRERDAPSRFDGEREPSLLADDLVQGRPPLPGGPSRNKGWGTPTYDEILEAKRRDELAYRRYDDPETRLGMPLAGKAYARNAGSESDISRDYADVGRLTARGGDQRKVSFADQATAVPAGGGGNDRRDFQRRRSDPSSENGRAVAPFYQDPAGGPTTRYNSTLLIGHEERPSATRKKKDAYRQDLMAQMEEAAQARKYEKQNELSVTATGLVDPIRALPGAVSRTPPPPSVGAAQLPAGPSYHPSVPEATRLPMSNGTTGRIDPYGFDNFVQQPAHNDFGILERGFGGLFDTRQPPHQPPLDTGYTRLSSNPYGNPIVLPPPPPMVPLPSFVPSAVTPTSGLYGGGHPTAAAAPYPAAGIYPHALPPAFYGPSSHQAVANAQQLPNGLSQQRPGMSSQHVGLPLSQPTQQQQQTSSTVKQGQQPSAVGLFSIGEDRQKQPKVDYSAELQKQIEERKMAKQKEKEEQQRYDQKLEAEIAAYNPFGRGGGGAPMKDAEGNTLADRRTLKKVTGEGQTPRGDIANVSPSAAVAKPLPAVPSASYADSSQANGVSATSDGSAPDGSAQNFARGGNGIFGEPKSDVQKTASDKYKEELRLQIEEKKRKQEEERRRAREEEDREAARLEDERLRIQREFDLEQQRARAKEEEARRKNEDLMKQADEKKKDTERKALEREESRQKAEQERQQREQPIGGRRSEAPMEVPRLPAVADSGAEEASHVKPVLPSPRANTVAGNVATAGQEPVPAATTRLKSAEVLSQLAHMRRQLQQERLRVENALEKQKADIAGLETNDGFRTGSNAGGNGGVDAFELARRRHGAPAASRRQTHAKDPTPASPLHPADDLARLGTVPESPERSSSSHLESTSSFVLPVKPQSSNSLLDGETAFIDTGHGIGLSYPDDFEELRIQDAGDRKRPDRGGGTPASARSVDPEKITRKNQDRLKKLKQIAGDDMSVADPDDIIDRFMAQHHKPRPASGQTLEDESWLKAGSR